MFEPKVFKIVFPNIEACNLFERSMTDLEGMKRIVYGPVFSEVAGGYEDGHIEAIYRVKWNKRKDFEYMIAKYNLYAEIFGQCRINWI